MTIIWILIEILSLAQSDEIDKIREKKLYYDYSFLSLYMAEKTYKRITPPSGYGAAYGFGNRFYTNYGGQPRKS